MTAASGGRYSWTIAYLICHAHRSDSNGVHRVRADTRTPACTAHRWHSTIRRCAGASRWYVSARRVRVCAFRWSCFHSVGIRCVGLLGWLTPVAGTVCNVFIQFVYLIWAPTPRLSDKFDIAPRPICHLLSALSKQMGLRAALFRLSTFLTASIEWSELASGTTQNKVIPPTRQLIYRQFFPIYSQVWTHESNDENGPHSRDNSWTC